MTRRIFLFISLILGSVLALTSCVDGNNKSTYLSYGVANYNSTMGATLITEIGEFAAPGTGSKVTPGDCVIAQYTIDQDNQPSTDYFTATEISMLEVNQFPIVLREIVEDDPQFDVEFISVVPYYIPAFRGKAFFEIAYAGYLKKTYQYSLTCDPETLDADGNFVFYLRARVSGEDSGSESFVADTFVFDISSLISSYGADAADDSNNSYRYVSAQIKYCNGISESGEYTYKNVFTAPAKFIIYQ